MFTELVENAQLFQWEKGNNPTTVTSETTESLKIFAKSLRLRLENDKEFTDTNLCNKLARISEFCYKSITPAILSEFYKKIVSIARKKILKRGTIIFFICWAITSSLLLKLGTAVGNKLVEPREVIFALLIAGIFSTMGALAGINERGFYKQLKITKLPFYNKTIPYGIMAKLKSAYTKKLFDHYSVIEIEDMKDPLLVGQVDNFPDYFIIGIWGNDMDGIAK